MRSFVYFLTCLKTSWNVRKFCTKQSKQRWIYGKNLVIIVNCTSHIFHVNLWYLSSMKFLSYSQCLKCGLVFYNREDANEGDLICANNDCLSPMVIEKKTNEIDVLDQQQVDETPYEGDQSNDTCDEEYNTLLSKHDDSSIAIVIPSLKHDVNNPTSVSSWPIYCQRRLE